MHDFKQILASELGCASTQIELVSPSVNRVFGVSLWPRVYQRAIAGIGKTRGIAIQHIQPGKP